MEKHYNLSNKAFLNQFADFTLDPTLFTHEAHLRFTWLHIKQSGIKKATEDIQQQIVDFVTHLGAKGKYHKTLTVAAIHAVHHFMKKSEADNFKDFIAEFPTLKSDFKGMISSHYSFDIFESEKAKIELIEPDLSPFD